MSNENNEETMPSEEMEKQAQEQFDAFIDNLLRECKQKKIEKLAQERIRAVAEKYLHEHELEEKQIPYEKIIADFRARHAAEINKQQEQETGRKYNQF